VLAPNHDEDLVLGKFLVDELCRELRLAHSSSFTTETRSSMESITHEDVSGTHDLREEHLVMVKHEEHLDLHGLQERYDS